MKDFLDELDMEVRDITAKNETNAESNTKQG
jgi:hypothetical protein